jgi:DNA repair exonuclease SbcCD ATPase subunit
MIKQLNSTNHTATKKIYHMADIHIRLDSKRHTEYREVFQRVYNLLDNETEESVIVLCGDILHSKTDLSPEVVDLTTDFFRNLGNRMDVILIMGNHDCNMSNTSSLDSLTPMVNELKCNYQFHYLKNTGAYEYKNLVFGVTSCVDNELLTASDINSDKIKIALYHGPVHGAKTDVGYRMNNTELTVDKFDGYDYTLLGDIHRFQYMDKNRKICYPSSLIQQNYGEDIKKHGVVCWDLVQKKSKFLPIHNDYGFCTLDVTKGKIEKLSYVPPKPTFRLRLSDTSTAEHMELCKELRQKYNVQEISYTIVASKNKYKDGVISDNTQINLNNIEQQTKLIEKYATSRLNFEKDVKLEHIKDIHAQLSLELDFKKEYQTNKWKIKDLEFSNMFCYGAKNCIDFEKMNNIVGLVAPNHYGKSSIVDIILFALFDKCSRGIRTDILNEHKKSFWCQLRFDIDGVEYLITRRAKVPKENAKNLKIDVDFCKENINRKDDTEPETISLNGKDRIETNKIICKYIGTYEDYIMTSFCLQNNTNFIDYQPSQKKDFLIRLLRLDLFEHLNRLAKDHHKSAVTIYKDTMTELNRSNKDELQNDLERTKNDMENNCVDKNILSEEIRIAHIKINNLTRELRTVGEPTDVSKLSAIKKENQKNLMNKKYLDEVVSKLIEEKSSLGTVNEKLKKQLGIVNEEELKKRQKEFDDLRDKKLKVLASRQKELYMAKKATIDISDVKRVNRIDVDVIREKINNLISRKDDNTLNITKLEESMTDTTSLIDLELKIKESVIIRDQTNHYNNEKRMLDQEISHMREKLDTLSKHEYDPKCKFCVNNIFVKDAIETKELLIEKEKQLKSYELKIRNLHKRIKKYDGFDNKYEEVQQNQKTNIKSSQQIEKLRCENYRIDCDIEGYQRTIVDLEKTIIMLAKYDNDIKFNKKINAELVDIENSILETERKTFDEYDIYQTKKQQVNKNEMALNKIQIELLVKERELERSILDIENCNNQMVAIELYISEIKINDQLEKDIKKVKLLIKQKTEQLNETVNNIHKAELKLAVLNSDLIKYNELFNKLCLYEHKKQVLSMYMKIVDKSGLPYDLLSNIVPKIHDEVNAIIHPLTNFTVNVELKDSDIIITKNSDKQKLSIDMCSGFEKFMVGLAIRIALSRHSNMSSCNFMIIDEGFSCLDSTNRSNLSILFDFMRETFNFVMIVSHIQELRGLCDNYIEIKKNNQGLSRILYK